MNFADLIIVLLLLVTIGVGWRRGLIRSLGNLLADLVALFIAWRVFDLVAGWIDQILPWSKNACSVSAFILVFTIADIIFTTLIFIIDRIFNWLAFIPFLKTINRIGGGIFGLVRGGFLISIFLYLFVIFPEWTWLNQQIAGSILVPNFQPLVSTWSFLLPLALRQLKIHL